MRLAVQYPFLSIIAFVMSSISFHLHAQDRCGSVEYNKSLHENYPSRKIQFERWITEKALPRERQTSRQQAASYQIPVVVHVIHNGEAIGTGANISDAQILSQLRVLNEDFTRQNADAANTPPAFTSVAGSLDIEFVLARQDADGVATNGIVRVNGRRSSWSMNDNYALKSLSYWPAEEYMNIWVCNLTDGHAGYAQFPEADIPGMENSSTNRLTDGVVIWHRAFGSKDDGAFNLDPTFNKGRTATHEIGHFLGLNHIWGDDAECNGTDHVADTPNQGRNTTGCPTHPRTDNCGQVIMFQNFLDYTDDECMNLFTKGQVERMSIVLDNSPRRNSLLTSPGLTTPDPLPNDAGIRSIIFPDATVCSNSITPVIEVRNYGSNDVATVRVRFVLDGTIRETRDFSVSLVTQASTQVAFSELVIPSGSHQIAFQILLTNGGTDSGTYNDLQTSTIIVPSFANTPVSENFTSMPGGWIIHNPDGQVTWTQATASNDAADNKALKLNYYDYEDKIGEIDVFLSPVIDLTSAPAARLTFEVAHARYQASNDRLRVVALTDCQDILDGVVLYNKAGDALKTAPATTSPFTPANASQWRKELIDLGAFVGMQRVQLAFIGINDWGNNIYIDNINIFTDETLDVALTGLASPSPVTCHDQISPRLRIQNAGSITVNEVTVAYTLNGGPQETFTASDLNLTFGSEKELELPLVNLQPGENHLDVTLQNPNGLPDVDDGNNNSSFMVVMNQAQDRIPLRINFDDVFLPAWTLVNPAGGMNWETVNTNFGQSLYFNAYDNTVIADEAWFVSPVLDLSSTDQAAMLFDISYAPRIDRQESLKILASTDCGNTFKEISFNFPETGNSEDSWFPEEEDDWSQNVSVNLNSVAGESDVRIAFVVMNRNGNNLYLDNIDFYVTSDPDPIDIKELFSVYGYDLTNPELSDLKITFNLPRRQDVRYSVITTTGQLETDGVLTDVLNQTFPLGLSERLVPGVYFIRVQIDGKFYTSRVLVY